jgi:hypothetical protein
LEGKEGRALCASSCSLSGHRTKERLCRFRKVNHGQARGGMREWVFLTDRLQALR